MKILSRNFNTIRNEYCIPLVEHLDIKMQEYHRLKVKNVILYNSLSVVNDNNNHYIFDVPISILHKAIISEIEQFYIRSKILLDDYNYLESNGSQSWRFTTQYYRFFFLTTCIQRIHKNGYFFLNEEQAKYLSDIASTFLNSLVKISKGNWEFNVIKKNVNNYQVLLKPAGSNVHQLMWSNLKRNLKKFIKNSQKEEKQFLEQLRIIINSTQNYSPSNTRNTLNYHAETSIFEIKKSIYCNSISKGALFKKLFLLNPSSDINNKIKITNILTEYLDLFLDEIINDLDVREKNGFKLIKKYKRMMKLNFAGASSIDSN
jgi:hypothetical protein